MKWSDLSMQNKSELMKLYLKNGITSLDTMIEHYNHFSEGGPISVNTWKTMMKARYPDIEFDNNKAGYDYDEYFKNNYLEAIKQLQNLQHFPDTYKLPNHKTFSDESIYSRGPNMGGSWSEDDTFTPNVINRQVYPDVYKEDRPYTEREIYSHKFGDGGFWSALKKRIRKIQQEVQPKTIPTRVRPNDTRTSKASSKMEDDMHENIYLNRVEDKLKYSIPYIKEKEIFINGNRTSENILDTLYKYAQETGLPFVDALGLAGQETGYGSWPLFNFADENGNYKYDDGTQMSKQDIKEWNNELANANYFRNYGSIPANNLIRNFAWEESDTDKNPILDGFKIFMKGKYNPGDPNHAADVRSVGNRDIVSPAVQNWARRTGAKLR